VNDRVLSELEPPFLDLHAATWTEKNAYTMMPDARRFETWETNYAGKIGLAAAVEYAMEWGLDSIWHRILELSSILRKQLSAIPGIILEDLGAHQCGIVTFISSKTDPQTLCSKLKEHKINISVSLQEYARLDLEARGLPSLVRASVHYYNTQEEIDLFCNELERIT